MNKLLIYTDQKIFIKDETNLDNYNKVRQSLKNVK